MRVSSSRGSSLLNASRETRPYRLRDTHLEPTHVPGRGAPVDGLPVPGFVGRRTNGERRRHLPRVLSRLARLSRDRRPEGSLRAFAPDDLVRIRPITGRRSLPPSSSTRTAIVGPRDPPTLRERYGLTLFRPDDEDGLGPPYDAGSVWCP
jgi:hypothetical protein